MRFTFSFFSSSVPVSTKIEYIYLLLNKTLSAFLSSYHQLSHHQRKECDLLFSLKHTAIIIKLLIFLL